MNIHTQTAAVFRAFQRWWPSAVALMVAAIARPQRLEPSWHDQALAGAVLLAGLALAAYYCSRERIPVPDGGRTPNSGPHPWMFILAWVGILVLIMPNHVGRFMTATGLVALVTLRLGGRNSWPVGVAVGLIAAVYSLSRDKLRALAELRNFIGPLDIYNLHHEHVAALKLLALADPVGPSCEWLQGLISVNAGRGLGPLGRDWALHVMQITGFVPVAALLIGWTMFMAWLATRLSWGQPSNTESVPWLRRLVASLLGMQAAAAAVYVLWVFGVLRQPTSPGAPLVDHASWWLVGLLTLILLTYTGVPAVANDDSVPAWRRPRRWLIAATLVLVLAVVVGRSLAPGKVATFPSPSRASLQAEAAAPEPKPLAPRKTLPPPPLPDIGSMASQELGTMLLALMPRRGEGWHWDRLANGPVHWLDKPVLRQRGEHGEAGLNSRTGIVRVNVLGQPVTVLRQRQDEVWWTLRYLSRTDLKWGVESITLAPGLPWGEDCWGLFYAGCHFYVASSLRRAGVRAEVICKDGPLGAPVTLMRLSHYGRVSVLLKLKANLGSGGANASLELHSGEAEVDCSE